MRHLIVILLSAVVALAHCAEAAPTSMISNAPAEKGSPSIGGMKWLTKWFNKPSEQAVAPVAQSTAGAAPNFAYEPAAAVAVAKPYQPQPAAPAVPQQPVVAVGPTLPTLPAAAPVASAEYKNFRERGHLEDRSGNLALAEIYYRKAIAADPMRAAAVNDLALCQARQGRLEDAAGTLTEAISMRPDKALYRNNIATVLVELGRPEEALGHLNEVYPPVVALHNLGQLHARADQPEQAARRLNEAIALDASFSPAREALAKLEPTPAPSSVAVSLPPAPAAAAPEAPTPRVAAAPSYENATSGYRASQSSPAPTNYPRLLPPVLDR